MSKKIIIKKYFSLLFAIIFFILVLIGSKEVKAATVYNATVYDWNYGRWFYGVSIQYTQWIATPSSYIACPSNVYPRHVAYAYVYVPGFSANHQLVLETGYNDRGCYIWEQHDENIRYNGTLPLGSAPSCSCGSYYPYYCSGSNRWYQRSCSPSGCSSEGYWAYDPSCVPPPPSISFYASPNPINQGGCTYLWWNSSNANYLYAYWLGYSVGTSGSSYVCPYNSSSYTMYASGPGGAINGYASVTVNVPPPPPQIISFYSNPSSIYTGNSSMLYWTHQNSSYGYVCGDNIHASNNPGGYGCLYTIAGNYPNYGGASAGPSSIGNHQYSLTMYNSSGNATTAYTNINVISPPPVLNLWPSSYTINQGSCTYLNWNSQYVNSIWSYWLSSYISSPSGWMSVCPLSTTTYSIAGYGPGGSTSRSVTISVMPPAPYVTLDAIPVSINRGQPVNLSWRSTNADRVISSNYGASSPNGNTTVYPNSDTTYTITVGDIYGRSYPASVNVRVNQAKELSGIFISKKINFVTGSYVIKQDSKTVSNTPPGFSELLAPIWKELIP